MTPLRLRQALESLLQSPANVELIGVQHALTVETRQTTTGSEQLHVVIDGAAFNVTITKARS